MSRLSRPLKAEVTTGDESESVRKWILERKLRRAREGKGSKIGGSILNN